MSDSELLMPAPLKSLSIKGFKSIKELNDFEIKPINILIGGNGAGKSNLIDFFRMIRAMLELPLPELSTSNLSMYLGNYGGFTEFLYNGPAHTKEISVKLLFGSNGYHFTLAHTASEGYVFSEEKGYYEGDFANTWKNYGSGHKSPKLLIQKDMPGKTANHGIAYYIYESIKSWCIYHFHNSSKETAKMRQYAIIQDNSYLRFDGSNIAPFLLHLRNERDHDDRYDKIINAIRLVAPFFNDFLLTVQSYPDGSEKVRLDWLQQGSDYPMQPYHLSDGTIRFICLATALLQPTVPSMIIIDEPELGLHPEAIYIFSELVHSASKDSQILISTQSPFLIDQFNLEDIVVVNKENGESIFKRLNLEEFNNWLSDYSLSELWEKGIIKGKP